MDELHLFCLITEPDPRCQLAYDGVYILSLYILWIVRHLICKCRRLEEDLSHTVLPQVQPGFIWLSMGSFEGWYFVNSCGAKHSKLSICYDL